MDHSYPVACHSIKEEIEDSFLKVYIPEVQVFKTEIKYEDESYLSPDLNPDVQDPNKYKNEHETHGFKEDTNSDSEDELEPGETNYEIISINNNRSYLFSKSTKMLYTRNGRKSNKTGEHVQYFKCLDKHCKASGSLAEGRNFIENSNNVHLHENGALLARQKIALNSLKTEIFDSIKAGSTTRSVEKFRLIEKGLLNYKKIRSQLSKLRKKTIGDIIDKDLVYN